MSATTTHWLVIGQRVLGNHEGLWEFCRACEDLLGEGGMVIAEYALGNCIEPWNAFFQKEFDRKKWSRGRLFGARFSGGLTGIGCGRLCWLTAQMRSRVRRRQTSYAGRMWKV